MAWIQYTAMSKLGFSLREYGMLTIGEWTDLFEEHKRNYNFEANRGRYEILEEEPVSSLDAI